MSADVRASEERPLAPLKALASWVLDPRLVGSRAMSHGSVETVTLTHGAVMPRLGLGTSPMDDGETERAVAQAIEAGYRLVDTAEDYGNERGVGQGLRASGLPREDVFITTKFNKRWHGADLVEKALVGSCQRLGVDYIDLFLVHWPNPAQERYVAAWRGLTRLLEDGRVRAIGTSNFKPVHLDRLIAETGVVPDLNQIQLNPLVTREAVRAYDTEHGIVTESWSPIGGQGADVLSAPEITEIAARHEKTPAQIVLRWHMQLGLVAVPKSSTPSRMRENIDIFDFDLSADDVGAISALDRGEGAAVDSDRFGH
jgi:2,5-diketo-D-gluconate reductase A